MVDKKVIIISGGSDGLGYSIAKRLAKENKVIILARNEKKLQVAAKEIKCEYEVCDVSKYSNCITAIESVIKKYNRIDYLINNAGMWIEGEVDSNEDMQISEAVNVNLLGTIFLSKACIPTMKKQKEGTIMNISSQAGLYAKGERAVYNATKWGVTGFTKSLEMELQKYKIRVIGIYPGKLNTKMFEKMGIKKDLSDALDPDEIAKTIEFIITLKQSTLIPEIGFRYI